MRHAQVRMYQYLAKLSPDSNSTVFVTFPDVPEAMSFGEDEEDAFRRGAEALEAALSIYMDRGLAVPKPTQRTATGPIIGVPALSDAKVCRYMAMRKAGITKAELAGRLGWRKSQVGRLLDLDHDSRMDQIEGSIPRSEKWIEFRVA